MVEPRVEHCVRATGAAKLFCLPGAPSKASSSPWAGRRPGPLRELHNLDLARVSHALGPANHRLSSVYRSDSDSRVPAGNIFSSALDRFRGLPVGLLDSRSDLFPPMALVAAR